MTGIITEDIKPAVKGFGLISVLDELESVLDSKLLDYLIDRDAGDKDINAGHESTNIVDIPEDDKVESIHGDLPETKKLTVDQASFDEIVGEHDVDIPEKDKVKNIHVDLSAVEAKNTKIDQDKFAEAGEHKEITMKVLSCSDCELKTDSERILELHRNYKHAVEGGREKELKDIQTGIKEAKPRRVTRIGPRNSSGVGDLHKCRICEFSTIGKKHLVTHFKNEHSGKKLYICDVCPYGSNWLPNLTNHKESIHDPKIYPCERCNYKTKWKATFLSHMREIHGVFKKVTKFSNAMNKPVACNLCEFSARTTKLMQYHKIKKHNNQEKKHKCDLCESKSFTIKGLANHKLWMHTKTAEERSKHFQYFCDVEQCSYVARKPIFLRRHKRNSHNFGAPKIFKCDICDHIADTRGALRCHRDNEHADIKYQCDQCSFVSKKKRYLMSHKEIHLGVEHPCEKCNYVGKSRFRLYSHKRQLHGGKEYPCVSCPFIGINKGYLRNHEVRIHQEKEQHPCKLCSFIANSKLNLGNHEKRIHQEKTQMCDQCNYKATFKYELEKHLIAVHYNENKTMGENPDEKFIKDEHAEESNVTVEKPNEEKET